MASNDEHVDALRMMLRYYTGNRDQAAILAAIRALSAQQPEAVALGYIGANVAEHLRAGGHAATTITNHRAMLDDVAVYAQPQVAVSDAEREAWRDLVRRAWQVLDVECPNEEITAELFAALRPDAGEQP